MIITIFQQLLDKHRWLFFVLLSLLSFASLVAIAQLLWSAGTDFQLDLHVFQDAGQAFRDGAPLYGEEFPARQGFPFIYPPLAALFFVPLTWAPTLVIQLAWTLTNLVAVWAILAMSYIRIQERLHLRERFPQLSRPLLLAFLTMGITLPIDPMQRLFEFGQIDVFLALLVVADLLGFTPKWARGLLIGFAAGIKITPAAFALYFLVQRDYRSIGRSILGMALTALAGFVVRPQDTIRFWTQEVFDSQRAGLPAYEDNQAISGLLRRSGVTGDTLDLLIVGFFIFGAVLAYFLVRFYYRTDKPVMAVFVLGLCVSLFGPYSVSNHWSVIIVGIPLLAVVSLENFIVGSVLWIGHMLAPYRIFPGDGHEPADVLTILYGNLQGELTLLVLAYISFEVVRDSRRERSHPTPNPEPSNP